MVKLDDVADFDDYDDPAGDLAAFQQGEKELTGATPQYEARLRRHQLGEFVMNLAKANRAFSDEHLNVRDAVGRHVLVPVLGSDSMRLVSQLVEEAGGHANVVAVIPSDEDGQAQLCTTALRVRVAVADGVADPDGRVLLSDETTVADLFRTTIPGTLLHYGFADVDVEQPAGHVDVDAADVAHIVAA